VSAFPAQARRAPSPRIAPGAPRELGPVNALICRAIGLGAGTGGPPNIFTTLGRHRGLFRRWLFFAGKLMPGGSLPRRDTELVILRVSVVCGCDYEWGHHVRLGRRAGLSDAEIERVGAGPDAEGWSDHERALLRAVDELHGDRLVGDETWAALSARYDERELIELCLLAGHYEMLAGTLNSLGVVPERA
jgi:AhpD family alkylhydroperoxidase